VMVPLTGMADWLCGSFTRSYKKGSIPFAGTDYSVSGTHGVCARKVLCKHSLIELSHGDVARLGCTTLATCVNEGSNPFFSTRRNLP